MPDRLRALLDHPLDRRVGVALAVLASAVVVGFSAVIIFYLGSAPEAPGTTPSTATRHRAEEIRQSPTNQQEAAASPVRHRRQDPQDRQGSPAARRAAAAMQTHRALQQVPYRQGGVVIRLIGARRGKAILGVEATSIKAARKGWRRFLRRFDDPGDSYLPRFSSASRRSPWE